MDLSEQLRARKPAAAAPDAAPSGDGAWQVSSPSAGTRAAGDSVAAQQRALFRRGRASAGFVSNPPSKGEARRWERNTRFAKRVRWWLLGRQGAMNISVLGRRLQCWSLAQVAGLGVSNVRSHDVTRHA